MLHYSRYIAKQLMHSTLLITVSLTSIVWLTQALRFIDFIVNQGVSIMVFLKLTLLLIPALLLVILPPAFFCAVMFTYNKLKTDSELIVMQAMGLSRWRLAVPVLRVAAIITCFAYFIALYLQPVSYREFKELQSFLRNNYVSIMLQEGVFSNPVDGLTVFIRERNDDGRLKGILVHDSRTPGTNVTMLADEGTLVQTPQGPRFLLQHGNRQEAQAGKLSFLNFDSYTLDISLFTKTIASRTRDSQELFLFELLKYDSKLTPQDNNKRRAEAHQRIIWPAYVVTLALVALAVLLSGQFNRRGQWKRMTWLSFLGTALLFSAVGLRGIVASKPSLAPLLYLWWLAPTLASIWVLKKEDFRPLKKALPV